jgi:hypothetical protein
MKTLQEQYNQIQKGKGSKQIFLKEAKSKFPNMITNIATFEETTKILKNRSVIAEELGGYIDLQPINTIEARPEETYETKFKAFLAEEAAKVVEKKATKEVEEMETAAYDYTDVKSLDNQIGVEVQEGIYFEAKQNPNKSIEEIKEIVAKNLSKDQLFYKKNAAFGVEGLGLEEMKSEEVSGNHKSSGYSDKLKTLVKESLLGGVVTTGNPKSMASIQNQVILDMLKEKEVTNESYDEFQRDDKGAADVDKKDKGEEDAFGAGVEAGEKIEKKKEKKVKKETIDSRLEEIESAGKITTLEAQIAHIEETMSTKEQRLSLVNEDSEMAELLDKGKVNQMRKEIKLLEKRANKMKKLYEKLNGSAYTAPVLDESDAYTFDVQNGTSLDAVPQKVGQSTTQE